MVASCREKVKRRLAFAPVRGDGKPIITAAGVKTKPSASLRAAGGRRIDFVEAGGREVV